jgi:hypothetical protein
MNERIKQLEKQCWQSSQSEPYALFDVKKFAQLIIAECTEQVRGQYVPVLEDEAMMKDTHWDGYVQCGVDSVVAIREHFFGVEE